VATFLAGVATQPAGPSLTTQLIVPVGHDLTLVVEVGSKHGSAFRFGGFRERPTPQRVAACKQADG
jgi:hypothetical protein